MKLHPQSRKTHVALLTIACGVVMLTMMGCNLTTPASQSISTVLILPTTEFVTTPVPTVEIAAAVVSVSELVSTPTTLNPPELIASQTVQTVAHSLVPLPAPVEPLIDPNYPLLGRAVEVPLEIRIPALQLWAPVLGVGLTVTNAMAAPVGVRLNDPIWSTIFWYRGGSIPGNIGTATFAGHFDDDLGRPAIFAFLAEIEVGDVIFVDDRRNGTEIPFIVTETEAYTRQESTDSAILARIFGSNSVSDSESQSAPDLVSRLTLITCDGVWVNGSFDQHLVVFATRASYPLG